MRPPLPPYCISKVSKTPYTYSAHRSVGAPTHASLCSLIDSMLQPRWTGKTEVCNHGCPCSFFPSLKSRPPLLPFIPLQRNATLRGSGPWIEGYPTPLAQLLSGFLAFWQDRGLQSRVRVGPVEVGHSQQNQGCPVWGLTVTIEDEGIHLGHQSLLVFLGGLLCCTDRRLAGFWSLIRWPLSVYSKRQLHSKRLQLPGGGCRPLAPRRTEQGTGTI